MKEPSDNLRYVMCFLVNAGERLRAVKLAVEFCGISIRDAINLVDENSRTFGPAWRKRVRELWLEESEINARCQAEYPHK